VRPVLVAVLSSRIYQHFVAAAPGLKELMTIGKIWYEAEGAGEGAERRWDVVVVDAPATGHGLQYLGMPAAAHEIFNSGLVGRESARLLGLLTDPERTAVNLVTTAEEMPANETREMYHRLTEELRMPLGAMFVNRVHHTDLTAADLAAAIEAFAGVRSKREQRLAEAVVRRAREEIGWAMVNAEQLERLATLDVPRYEIPYAFVEKFGAAQLDEIIAPLRPRARRRAAG
jgi:anion-transporting  ArsA/GET3 family ATPase